MESENKLTVIEDNSMLVFGSQNNFENAQRMAKAPLQFNNRPGDVPGRKEPSQLHCRP